MGQMVVGYQATMDIVRNDATGRYEAVDGEAVVGVADFRERDGRMILPHTEVHPARRGQGIGDRLIEAALDDARQRGLKVVPRCWFAAEYIRDHPAYADLVA